MLLIHNSGLGTPVPSVRKGHLGLDAGGLGGSSHEDSHNGRELDRTDGNEGGDLTANNNYSGRGVLTASGFTWDQNRAWARSRCCCSRSAKGYA